MDHLGCGATSGATIVLKRSADGEWGNEQTLRTVIS